MGALLNVLSFPTYSAPGSDGNTTMDDAELQLWLDNDINALSKEDRKLFCLARGQAFEIIASINVHFTIRETDTSPFMLFTSLLVHICKAILHYKTLADNNSIEHNPDLTLDKIQIQITGLLSMEFLEIVDHDATKWKFPIFHNADCPIFLDQIFGLSLQKIPKAQYARLTLEGLFEEGETNLDKKFAQELNIKQEPLGMATLILNYCIPFNLLVIYHSR